MDNDLLADAQELIDKRTSGDFVGKNPSYEDAFGALAGALGQDTAMIYRLAREVDRLSREVRELRKATGNDPRA